MVGGQEIAGIDSSTNALTWAAEVLRGRLEEVLSLRNNALDSADIEGVHQMRVAIRRLRSALRDFSPLLKSRLLKESKKELKQLADILGQARDQDVAIAALEKLRDTAKNERVKNDIEKKIEKRHIDRKSTQNELIKVLDVSTLENLRRNFLKAVDESDRKNQKLSKLNAKAAGQILISKSLREFCALSFSLYKPFNQEKLHELRIAAKRLRYAIELFTVFWGEQLSPFTKEISDMQTNLGELHDCDIWIENLSQRLNKEKGEKKLADFWLLSKFTKERTRNYREALRLWSKWQKNKFMKRLRDALEMKSLVDTNVTD